MIREYLKTMMVSGSGALLALLVTASLTEFVFGREDYFLAYLIGVVVSVGYSFFFLSRKVFRSPEKKTSRFVLFLLYMTFLVLIQVTGVKYLVGLFGVDWYLPVIAGIMFAISLMSFLVYKFIIFR